MEKCVMCLEKTHYGIMHNNKNLLCLECVEAIKNAHIKIHNFAGGY
jgi:hypothetical protein